MKVVEQAKRVRKAFSYTKTKRVKPNGKSLIIDVYEVQRFFRRAYFFLFHFLLSEKCSSSNDDGIEKKKKRKK